MLAVAAARLGWAPVTALELDAAAVAVIAANGAANGVAVEARAARPHGRGGAVGADRLREPLRARC